MFRVLVVLAVGLLLLLTIVILRVETARLEHRMSQLDEEQVELVATLRIREAELARSRNPDLIREEVTEQQLERQAAEAARQKAEAAGKEP